MHELLQEIYADDPYKVLVACILLNQTNRKQVDQVRDEFFSFYPEPYSLLSANVEELQEQLRPLGLFRRKAATLKRFARDYIDWQNGSMTLDMAYGVGEYAFDSYRIFCQKDVSRCDSNDKEILAWAARNGIEFA